MVKQKSVNHVLKENTIQLSMVLVLNALIKVILCPVFQVAMMNAPYLNLIMMEKVALIVHKYLALIQEDVKTVKKDFISIKIKESAPK